MISYKRGPFDIIIIIETETRKGVIKYLESFAGMVKHEQGPISCAVTIMDISIGCLLYTSDAADE